jgi:transposase-like protein
MGAEDLIKVALGVADIVAAEQLIEGVEDVRHAQMLAERKAIADKVCPHTALTPHWDSARDMGNRAEASSFSCEGCQKTFTPDEVKAFKATGPQLGSEPRQA